MKSDETKALAELALVHALLDSIEVPRRVSDGAAEDDRAYDRLIWLLHRGASGVALESLLDQREIGKEAANHLKKMVALYEQEHGPHDGSQTVPWMIARWAKTNLP